MLGLTVFMCVCEHDHLYTHIHTSCMFCMHVHAHIHVRVHTYMPPPQAWPMRRDKTGSALDSDMNKPEHPRGNKRHAGEDRKTGEEKGGLCPL